MNFMQTLKAAVLVGAAVILGGCAHPQLVDMGETTQQVQEYLGAPDAKTPMPDGRERWTYSMQPFGQQVWWLFFDGNGQLVEREQGLQRKYFTMAKIGTWTEDDVWRFWGKCAEKYEFPLVDQHAWMYRFIDVGGFYMDVWPQFDKSGVLRSMDVTLDPWVLQDGDSSYQ